MPNCFKLTKKGETSPTVLTKIDEEICAHMGVVPHERWWYLGWYDTIGFAIAIGKGLGTKELRDWVADMPQETEKLLRILDFLEERYTSDAWVEVGRR